MTQRASSIHVYTTRAQPATRQVHDIGPSMRPVIVRLRPRQLVRCASCRKLRWAAHATARVYYDMTTYACADGHGCRRARLAGER